MVSAFSVRGVYTRLVTIENISCCKLIFCWTLMIFCDVITVAADNDNAVSN